MSNSYDFSWAPKTWTRAPAVPVWTSYFNRSNPHLVVPKDDIRKCTTSMPKVWGATFDDGPSPYTPQLIEYFKEKKMNTTFYIVGSVALQHPKILLDTYNAGHEIGIHTWSHPKLTEVKSDDEIIAEFVYTAKVIHQVTGQAIRYIRPPYGQSNARVRRLAATIGLQVVSYIDTQDWMYYNDQVKMEPVVMGHVRQWIAENRTGEITLQHDVWQPEVTVAIKAMDAVIKAGYTVMPIYQCLEEDSPYGNSILEDFFTNGQFESKEHLVPSYEETKPTPSTTETRTTSTIPPILVSSIVDVPINTIRPFVSSTTHSFSVLALSLIAAMFLY